MGKAGDLVPSAFPLKIERVGKDLGTRLEERVGVLLNIKRNVLQIRKTRKQPNKTKEYLRIS